MAFLEKHHIKRIVRYAFFITIILWTISSIFLWYKYVWFSANKKNTKWGTFVEGIFDNTSYLPYLRNDWQSFFYQGLLFNWCLKHSISNKWIEFSEDLCQITSKDNKTFFVNIHPGTIRSDGTPLSIDDVLFTYQDIVVKNKRWIKNLSTYKELQISQEQDSSIKIVFPTDSVDNKLFFTQHILPNHILKDFDFQSYRDVFSMKPTYTNCANIVSQTSDQYSLIFNLVNCPDTNLNFYQIKNHLSFQNFEDSIADKKNSIVDVYLWEKTFPGYEQHQIQTNKIVSVFFNTKSNKLLVRNRRALGGLIKRNFYSTGYTDYLIKNDDGLFDTFLSTWLNIKDYLDTNYEANTVIKKDLIDSGIKELNTDISIKWENKKFVFYTEEEILKSWFNITFDTSYDRIGMEYNQKLISASSYSSKDKKATFSFGKNAQTFGTWLNKYTILWRKNNKKITLATIDIYNLVEEDTKITENSAPISIIYYDSDIYDKVVWNLKAIFKNFDVIDYFQFEKITTHEELEWRLLLGDYDIMINTIDMWLKTDMTKLFATNSAVSNPSQYQNTKLTSLLSQYSQKADHKVLKEINDIYSKDMPFVILWKTFIPMQVKSNVAEKMFPEEWDTLDLYDYNWREMIYKDLKLVSTVHIDGKKVWNRDNFSMFIKDALNIKYTKTVDQTDNEDYYDDEEYYD